MKKWEKGKKKINDANEGGLILSMWCLSNPGLHGLFYKAVADELSRRRPIIIKKVLKIHLTEL